MRFEKARFRVRQLPRRAGSSSDPSGCEAREESCIDSESRQVEAVRPAELNPARAFEAESEDPICMKAYVVTTGLVFVLIVAAHIARIVAEGPRLLKEPTFVLTSTLSIGLATWAWRLFRQLPRSHENA